MKYFLTMANGIEKLEGGTYTIDTILQIIRTLTTWATTVGISLAGLALLIGFVKYTVSDVEQKPRIKQLIIQTLLGIVGIILAISLVNIIIDLCVRSSQ